MLTWLIVIILAYFFFSLAYLADKLILSGPALAGRQAKPNSYTFFIGVLSALAVFLIPFVKFGFPPQKIFFLIIADAAAYVLGLYFMFSALGKFDVSRVMTTIGATQPVFIFALTWLFWGPQLMSQTGILAFVLLIAGSIIISLEKKFKITGGYLKITIFSAVMFSLDYVFQKIIYSNQPFLQGLIWIRIFIFLFCLVFLLTKKSREEIFEKKGILNRKTGTIFIFAQTSGGLAGLLQSFAIFLAPVAFLPILNSLRGIQYVFLFLLTLFFTVFFPKILKEEVSREIIAQKIISIILIVAGLYMLVY